MSYFSVLAIVVAIAVLGAFPLRYCGRWRSFIVRYAWSTALVMTLIFAVVYAVLSCLRFYHLVNGVWDLGSFDSMVHNLAAFKSFMRCYAGGIMEHFCPMLILLVPLYWIWDSTYVMLICQAVVMAVAAIPLYRFTALKTGRNEYALLAVLFYLFNPYFSRYVMYDFHPGCVFPLLYFSAWLAWEKKQRWLFLLLLGVAPTAYESFCMVLIATGIFLLVMKEYRYGVILLGMALFWTVFVTKIWFPHILPLTYHHTDRYVAIDFSSFGGILSWGFRMLGRGMNWTSLKVILSVLVPCGFLPLCNWRALIFLLLPVLPAQLCSTFFHQQLLMSHYSETVTVVTAVAAVFGLASLDRMIRHWTAPRRDYLMAWLVMLPVVVHVFFCDLATDQWKQYIIRFVPSRQFALLSIPFRGMHWDSRHAEIYYRLCKIIPPGSVVAVQNNLGVPLIRRNVVHLLPGPDNSDFFIFDRKTNRGFDSSQSLNGRIEWLNDNPDYVCVSEYDGFIFFCRRKLAEEIAARQRRESSGGR